MILKMVGLGVQYAGFVHEFGIRFCQNRIVTAMVFIFTGRSCFHLAGLLFFSHGRNNHKDDYPQRSISQGFSETICRTGNTTDQTRFHNRRQFDGELFPIP